MEVINGEFYMLGCREDDPGCIRSPEELKRLISEIGFLPLFSNTIPGFSVEERTLASAWWTGDPASDPWTWREFLSSDPELAYGYILHNESTNSRRTKRRLLHLQNGEKCRGSHS